MDIESPPMRILIIFVLLLISVQSNGQIDNARLGEPLSGLIIESALYLPLPEGEIESARILDGSKNQLFRKLSSFEEVLDPDVHEYWIKLELKNITSESTAWVFDFENWTKVIAYVTESGTYAQLKSGHLLPFKERDFAKANKSLIVLKIGARKRRLFISIWGPLLIICRFQPILDSRYSLKINLKEMKLTIGSHWGFSPGPI